MKILATADYHIKLNSRNIPDEWAISRYTELFKKLSDIELEVDVHIVMGDFLDKVPNMRELQLFFLFISTRKCRTIIFAGNHEAERKNTTFLTYFKDTVNMLNPLVSIIDDYYSENTFDIIPYNKLKDFEKNGYEFNNKLLFTHCRGSIPPHVKPEVNLSIFEQWDVVLLGDLHSHSNSQLNLVYPGSPLTTSFHRNPVDTGVLIIDTNTLKWDWIKLEVPQLIRKTVKAGEPMPATDYHHTIYEVTGDMTELGKVESNELIDKKLVKRNNDCALILKPEATIQEELTEYFTYILQVPEATITEAIAEYNNNIKGIMI